MEVSYEALTESPRQQLTKVLKRLGEDPAAIHWDRVATHAEQNLYQQALSPEDVTLVQSMLAPFMTRYGY